MQRFIWGFDGKKFSQSQPLHFDHGERLRIVLSNDTMMAHPIHLHGHVFQVVAIDGQPIQGAVRDTVLVMPMGRVRIAFDADNPGRWPLHCHNLYHMVTGMMTELRYQGTSF